MPQTLTPPAGTSTRRSPIARRGTTCPLGPELLPAPVQNPLLTGDLVGGGDRIITVADPFPVSCRGSLFVLAEIEGHRQTGAYFKKLGAFAVDDSLQSAQYLGELWQADDGEYSFPYVLPDGDRLLLIPDVNAPGQPAQKHFRIYTTTPGDFPFGWKLLAEPTLPGAPRPSDKVLIRHQNRWWLWVSDALQGGRLLLYFSDDLQNWTPHPCNPLLHRPQWERAANRLISPRLFRVRPWRLGGGVAVYQDCPVLFVQHMYRRANYGEAVTPVLITRLDERHVEFQLAPTPILAADESIGWQSQSAHHVALARHGATCVVATDGSDGQVWSSTVQRIAPEAAAVLSPWGAAHA